MRTLAISHWGVLLAHACGLGLGLLLVGCSVPIIREPPTVSMSAWLPVTEGPPAMPGSQAPGSQEPDSQEEVMVETVTVYRWHAPRKQSRDTPRETPSATEPDWNTVGVASTNWKRALEAHGITQDLDVAFYSQWADGNETGTKSRTTATWQSVGDWEAWKSDGEDATYASWVLFGAQGLGYDTHDRTLTGHVGSISGLNANVQPDPIIVDELFVKHVASDGDRIYALGKVDLTYTFDTNRAANDGYAQFQALSLVNNLSIPFPSYGSFGGWMRADFGETYAMLGVADSAMFKPVAPWKTLDENSRYQLGELGIHTDSEVLGKGTIRLNPWHNHLFGEDGWGMGLNVDQDLGSEDVIGFLRAGYGDGDVTRVERFLSGGVSVAGLFDRPKDTFGLGASWADPSSGNGTRSETLIESYYSIHLSPTVVLSPDLQLLLHPAEKRRNNRVVMAGFRLVVQL